MKNVMSAIFHNSNLIDATVEILPLETKMKGNIRLLVWPLLADYGLSGIGFNLT